MTPSIKVKLSSVELRALCDHFRIACLPAHQPHDQFGRLLTEHQRALTVFLQRRADATRQMYQTSLTLDSLQALAFQLLWWLTEQTTDDFTRVVGDRIVAAIDQKAVSNAAIHA